LYMYIRVCVYCMCEYYVCVYVHYTHILTCM
jgi:hypothetical protein